VLADEFIELRRHSEPKDEDDQGADTKSPGIAWALKIDLEKDEVVDYIHHQECREKGIFPEQPLPQKPNYDQSFGQERCRP